jgi:hypothetical protein
MIVKIVHKLYRTSRLRDNSHYNIIYFLSNHLLDVRGGGGYSLIYLILIYLLTAIGLTPGSSSTVHTYTQTIYRTIQITTLVERLSRIRTQSGQTKINDEITA